MTFTKKYQNLLNDYQAINSKDEAQQWFKELKDLLVGKNYFDLSWKFGQKNRFEIRRSYNFNNIKIAIEKEKKAHEIKPRLLFSIKGWFANIDKQQRKQTNPWLITCLPTGPEYKELKNDFENYCQLINQPEILVEIADKIVGTFYFKIDLAVSVLQLEGEELKSLESELDFHFRTKLNEILALRKQKQQIKTIDFIAESLEDILKTDHLANFLTLSQKLNRLDGTEIDYKAVKNKCEEDINNLLDFAKRNHLDSATAEITANRERLSLSTSPKRPALLRTDSFQRIFEDYFTSNLLKKSSKIVEVNDENLEKVLSLQERYDSLQTEGVHPGSPLRTFYVTNRGKIEFEKNRVSKLIGDYTRCKISRESYQKNFEQLEDKNNFISKPPKRERESHNSSKTDSPRAN